MNQELAESVKDLAKPCNDVLERLGWKWKPKVGEWFNGGDGHIYLLDKDLLWEIEQGVISLKDCTPILHWEYIEGVLREVKYVLYEVYSSAGRYMAEINDKCQSFGDSRQEAVVRSVIALGKELT